MKVEPASKMTRWVRIRLENRKPPGKPQSRSEARDSGAEGVLDGGILPPSPPKVIVL